MLQSGRSVHVASPRREAVHCGQHGLRCNARITLQAAIASTGQNYQVLDHDYQPRAMGAPLQAVMAASMHATLPRLAHNVDTLSGCQRLHATSRTMSYAASGC